MRHPATGIGTLACGIALTALGAHLSSQQATPLPATAPTSVPAQGSTTAAGLNPAAVTPSQLPSANPPVTATGRATELRWDGHLLQISADGESLSSVLAAVATRTGLHINGSTPGDRIFGNYGPAPLVDVVSDLVGGLDVNMIFVGRSGTRPAELTFSPRSGPASPPNPQAQQQAYAQPQFGQSPYDQSNNPRPPRYAVQPPPQQNGPGLPPEASPQNGIPPAADAGDDNATGNPASPNGVKTPQEIFEQLQRLRNGGSANPNQ